MTKNSAEADRRIVLLALAERPLTYSEVSYLHLPGENGRRADRTLQALRTRGLVRCVRGIGKPLWKITKAGLANIQAPGTFSFRCEITRNPCGTDTYLADDPPCNCQGCRAHTLQQTLWAIADYVEPHWRGAGLSPSCDWLLAEIEADRVTLAGLNDADRCLSGESSKSR